jgi:AraC family transcriptional activator of mtrCDE
MLRSVTVREEQWIAPAHVRMTVASNALKTLDVTAVAELAGYQSEAAFQRAFRQRMGIASAQWWRQMRSSGDNAQP